MADLMDSYIQDKILRFQKVVTQDHNIASKNKLLDAHELTSTLDLKSLQVEYVEQSVATYEIEITELLLLSPDEHNLNCWIWISMHKLNLFFE